MDQAAYDAVKGEYCTDTSGMKTEAAGEFKWKRGICTIVELTRMMHEDGEDLVVGDGVEGQECVGD